MHIASYDMTKVVGTHKITPSHGKKVYTEGHWVDLNGDGLLDYITTRYDAFDYQGELLWYEHPQDSSGLYGKEWTEHLITYGPLHLKEIHTLEAYPNEIIVWGTHSDDDK